MFVPALQFADTGAVPESKCCRRPQRKARISRQRFAAGARTYACSDRLVGSRVPSVQSIRAQSPEGRAEADSLCLSAMTSLQRQPLIVCIRLKSFLVRDYYGDWTPLGQIQKRLLFMAEENRIPLADHEARTAAMVVYIAKILVEAGLYNLEITMDMPGVEYALSYLHEILGDSVMLGAGTVLQGKQLQRAIAAGCRFAMSPVLLSGLTERLIHEANQHHVLFIPGAATPSECVQASLALGEGRPVKVFPADVVGGLRFVRAMASPLSHIPLVPTSGITFDGVQGYLEAANVYAVGASQQILPPEQLLAGDWGRIHQLASQWRRVVESYARCKAVCLKASQSNECKA